MDENNIKFLNIFSPNACKGATYPMGWLRCPWLLQAYSPGTEPKFRLGRPFLGSTEAVELILDSVVAVHVGIRTGCRAS